MKEDQNEYMNTGRDDRSLESQATEAEDAALDALVLRFGGDYNRPPDIVPREEMWHEIRQKHVPRRFIHQHPAWSVLAAAVLLLGVGIGIGFETHARVATPTRSVAAGTSEVAGTAPVSAADNHDTSSVQAKQSTPKLPIAGPVVVTSHPVYASDHSVSEFNGTARSTAYTLATVRHFTAVEALLTSFQTSPHDARGDAQMASWARALLSQTRLLLDSPAAVDPARQRLLQDLELVLVQMTQLSPADAPIDREMINSSVRHTDVITRLRTAVPAGGTTHL